jgi:electron transfer flavoprotein beta subunit
MKPEDLGVDLSSRLETIRVDAPPARQGGAKVRRVGLLMEGLFR